MDPYLEGYLWPDVHQRLATEISKQLAPRLKPRYVARLTISLIRDKTPESEIGILYPDVEVIKPNQRETPRLPDRSRSGSLAGLALPTITEPLTLPRLDFEIRVVTVEIRDTAQNQLVTSIEILSPVNKRDPGLTEYRRKRERLEEAGVHLLEIDLLRRGERPLAYYPQLSSTAYLATLTRAQANSMAFWPIPLQAELPVVAVPLREPDADIPLELGPALSTIYDEAVYELSIDYSQPPPPPPLSPEDTTWLQECIREWQRQSQP
jgi:hypothetical protein